MERSDQVPEAEYQVDKYKLREITIDSVLWTDQPNIMAKPKPVDQVAALLKGINLDMPDEWTDEQIINRVYRHFGGAACRFDNRDWIAFVRSLIRDDA